MFTVNKPWPSTVTLLVLVNKASGQYLFVKTVLEFVGSSSDVPVKLLNILMDQHPAAFSAMDDLYTQILEACPGQREPLQCILGICVYTQKYKIVLAQTAFAQISGLPMEDVMMSFQGLNALLDIRDEDTNENEDIRPDNISQLIHLQYYSPYVSVQHISFVEFLSDKKQLGKFHVDKDVVYKWLMDHADILIMNGLIYGQYETSIFLYISCV